MKNQSCRIRMAVVALGFLTAVVPAVAQTDFGKFPLSKAIPDDVFIAVAAKGNPERAFLDAYWGEVHKAFMDSGILTDIWDLVMENVDDEQLEMVEDLHERFGTLCHAVDWSELFGTEMIWAGRFYRPFPQAFQFEGVLAGRMTKEKAAANYKALKALLEEIVKVVETQGGEGVLKVTEDKADGITTAALEVLAVPGMKVISISAWKDTIVIGVGGTQIARDAVALLQGKSDKKALLDSPRFQGAFKKLPPAEDSLVFFDSSGMMNSMNGMVKMIEGSMQAGGRKGKAAARRAARGAEDEEQADSPRPKAKRPALEPDEDESEADDADNDSDADADEEADAEDQPADATDDPAAWMRVVSRLLDDMSTFDYIAEVEWTDGLRVHTEHLTSIRPGTEKNGFTKAICSGKALDDYAKFVPREATTFSCSGSFDLSKLYDYVIDFIRDSVPGGPGLLESWDGIQQGPLGINVRDEIFALYTGPFISYNAGQDWVLLVGVTNEEKAADQMERLVAFVKEKVGQEQGLTLTPTEIGKAKFTQISHPMMMMMGGLSPVVGCAEGHLVIGSSSKAVSTCLKTASGQHPNITKSKQFTAEAMMPKGDRVVSISFTDERNFAEELQGAIAGLSMGMGFMAMGAQEMPPPMQAVVRAVPPILAKLAPVAGKLNFYQSSSTYTTFDGKAWRTHSVQNYKKPQPKPAEEDASGESESDGDSDDQSDDDADE